MKACVLKSCLSGLLLAPSFASWSTFSLPAMPACPGTQLIATSAFSTSFSMSPMWLLNVRDCAWAFPGVPLYIHVSAAVLSA